ncbi:DHHW family protein [Anaerosalibacter sp. Marseille-P3206]|uniref:DHHW family protein n=1 Tax=Anaerosalibacter sp. Marseille-P3206 TaxID=1871005 RepID=UPI000BE7D87F|nr:DHHW family protein [Anaerosalibacter sp. Marseille-P3206]
MEVNKNIYKKLIGSLLLIYIGTIGTINILVPDRDFSDIENRRLEQKPQFSMEKLFKGDYTSNFEKYISDQFPFRDFFIGVKSDCERMIGKKENNEVFLCKDGYLMEKFNEPEVEDFNKKLNAINSFAFSNPQTNIYFMLVPNSVKVMEEKLPKFAPVDNELDFIDKVKYSIDDSVDFVDVYGVLSNNKDDYIYYKTDHHWTTKGAYYAYRELGKYMGFEPYLEDDFKIKEVSDSFYGSLYSKGGFRRLDPDSIQLYIPKAENTYEVEYYDEGETSKSIYDMDNLNKKDKYTVFLNGNHPVLKISTNVNNGKTLLVIKDSYANSFIPFLTEHFSEIYMVDLRYYNEDLSDFMRDKNIEDVLLLYNVKSFCEDESIEKISW